MASSAIMNPAYYLSTPAPRRPNPVNQSRPVRDSLESDYSLVKPMDNVSPKSKSLLGIFAKDKSPKKTQAASTRKVIETNIHDIAHGTSAWK
ncbi:MAG: hypothetical protein GOMPHAMPRED_000486 [Gomphillus americanus]|uniref:Uncharacterized protein n=1 Tax=Gomphillus americanus TaxID=1940652 RepID=A0A8H3HV52_9LECA|nr:MAG: hypothetical protein GOMPHAMPRED_000486 [Gomphillus americanus]